MVPPRPYNYYEKLCHAFYARPILQFFYHLGDERWRCVRSLCIGPLDQLRFCRNHALDATPTHGVAGDCAERNERYIRCIVLSNYSILCRHDGLGG